MGAVPVADLWPPLICALAVGALALTCHGLGWHTANRDTAADARVKALESELAAIRQVAVTSRRVYLDRLARCRGCATCNPEPQGLAQTRKHLVAFTHLDPDQEHAND
jgi:hypothetical protein